MKTAFTILIFIALAACTTTAQQRPDDPQTTVKNQKIELPEVERYINLFDYRVLGDLTANGYTLERRPRRGDNDDVYAILRRNKQTVMKFDALEKGGFSAVDFGLFAFLDKKNPQIFVSQTAPRTGVHWIINTKPAFKVLFDSSKYQVGRDDFQVIDVDGDGNYELALESTAFYGFESLHFNVSVPLTEIIFKYDQQTQEFLPANVEFSNYSLRQIAAQIADIRRDSKEQQFADVLAITLRYVYAGQETAGWEFFQREYNFTDAGQLEIRIKAVLNRDPVYQFIYRKS